MTRILFIDIETSPIVAHTWGPKWDTSIVNFIEQSQVMSFSAKWLGGKQVTRGLIDYPGYKKNVVDDRKILLDIHKLLGEADIVVTQNGISFDHKVINARFIKHGLAPPAPYKMVDTKNEAKRYLRLPSYSLDDMCKYFELGKKMEHEGFELWKSCLAGDKKSWATMKRYNAHDVLLTEALYKKLLPYMKTHPNFSVYAEKNSCPKCESTDIQLRGYTANSTAMYQRAQCKACGGWFRFGKAVHKIKTSRTNI